MKRNKTWYKPKGYLHFSPKLKDIHKSMVSSYIEKDLDNHNFFPLIHETLIARRYKQYLDKDNKVYRSHYNASKKKSSKKPREIFYANHLDAHIYSFFANEILGKEYENILKLDQNLSDSIIAYRKIPITSGSKKNKCNIQFAEEVFKEIEKRTNCVVVCYDIENFFPSLNHQYLETCWENLLKKDLPKSHKKVLSSLTRYSYVELNDVIKVCRNEELKMFHKNDFRKSDLNSYFLTSKEFRTKIAKNNLIRIHKPDKTTGELKGIPQGTPISAFLANLYLLEFDKYIVHGVCEKNNFFYRRYSDDIVIIFDNLDSYYTWNTDIIKKISSSPFEMKINSAKTVVSIFYQNGNKISCRTKTELSDDFIENVPLRYLGFEFDGSNILLKSASLSKFYREMKMKVRVKENRVKKAKQYNRNHPEEKQKNTALYLTKLFSRFSHLGKNKSKSNYLTYTDRAAKELYPNVKGSSNPISRQIRRSWSILIKTIESYKQGTRIKLKQKKRP